MTQKTTTEQAHEQAARNPGEKEPATRYAILGLGAMGKRIAARLLAAGHALIVWNRSPAAAEELRQAGARVAETPRQAAAEADVVISMVTDDQAARSLWTHPESGALAGLREHAVAVEMSTVTPGWAVELAELAQASGALCVDAPVVGSRPQADAGQLVYLVGGSTEAVKRLAPVFSATSSAAHHLGPSGAGASMKLVVNALFGIQVAALGELLGLAQRSRLDVGRVLQVLQELAVTSPAIKGASGLISARNFAPLFPLALVEKDFRYAVELAEKAGAIAPLTRQALATFSHACERGLAAENITGVVKLFE